MGKVVVFGSREVEVRLVWMRRWVAVWVVGPNLSGEWVLVVQLMDRRNVHLEAG